MEKTHAYDIDFKNEVNEKIPKPHERQYFLAEEILHTVTHGIGAILGIAGLVLLILKALPLGVVATVGAVVFGISLIALYSASALYHGSCAYYGEFVVSPIRDFFMKCDHCMIFILIVGTYTPACIYAMGGWVGWCVFGVVATSSILGLVLNSVDVDRYHKISLVLYLVTGWTIAAASVPYFKAIGPVGFAFLLFGGAFYTIGIVFYKMQKVPYMHVIWHLFVIGGSVMHFFMVYGYCLT